MRRAEVRSGGGSASRTAYRISVVHPEVEIFHLQRPGAGPRPLEPGAGNGEGARVASGCGQEGGSARGPAAGIDRRRIDFRHAESRFGIKEGAVGGVAEPPRESGKVIADGGAVEDIEFIAVGIHSSAFEMHVAGLALGAPHIV